MLKFKEFFFNFQYGRRKIYLPCICACTSEFLRQLLLHIVCRCKFHCHWSNSPELDCWGWLPPLPQLWSELHQYLENQNNKMFSCTVKCLKIFRYFYWWFMLESQLPMFTHWLFLPRRLSCFYLFLNSFPVFPLWVAWPQDQEEESGADLAQVLSCFVMNMMMRMRMRMIC